MEEQKYPRRKSSCHQSGNTVRSSSIDNVEERHKAMTLEEFNNTFYDREKQPENIKYKIANSLSEKCVTCWSWSSVVSYVVALFPILTWLPRYQWRDKLASDLVAGLTVAIMHIPQGMAYALLAGVEPVTGIYTGMWPVLVYVVMGNMPHVSMGTFAIICIMVSQVVHTHSGQYTGNGSGGNVTSVNSTEELESVTSLEIVTAVTLCVGIIQTMIGLLRLGSLTKLISDTIISSFTVGASVHVASSQVRHVLGLESVGALGPGRIVVTYLGLCDQLHNTNMVTLAISVSCVTSLVLSDMVLQPKAKEYCKFPLPSQLVVMLVMAAISHYLKLSEVWGVRTIQNIGSIPTSLPTPSTDHLTLVPGVLLPSVPIAVVSIVISLGLGSMFGSKHGYKVPPNPECVAQGVSNILGSFLSCVPMSASLSRSLVQERSGCETLLTGLTSSLTLLAVILSLAPLFEPLPVCVLASIILASLSGMVKKLAEVTQYWSRSRWDGSLWIVTFISTVLIDVDLGLIIGLLVSIVIVLFRSVIPTVTLLERDQKTGVWLDRNKYETVSSQKSLQVIQIRGSVNFLTIGLVKMLISEEIGIVGGKRRQSWKERSLIPSRLVKVKLDEENGHETQTTDSEEECKAYRKRVSTSEEEEDKAEDKLFRSSLTSSRNFLLDLTHVTWLDRAGCSVIDWSAKELSLSGIVLPLHLEEVVEQWPGFKKIKCQLYPTLRDAIQLAVD